uniref:C-type lectin domain-containing protein n=1 Tax=Cyclopterus lumpus TaxID=8103 RepID=A0A8C2WA03_CYCLU
MVSLPTNLNTFEFLDCCLWSVIHLRFQMILIDLFYVFLQEMCFGLLQTRGPKTVECWSYFYSNTNNMSWPQARAWCQEHYTDMVAIQNQEEIGHLNSWLPKKRTYYWIGIRKVEHVWTWVGTGKALTAEPQGFGTLRSRFVSVPANLLCFYL